MIFSITAMPEVVYADVWDTAHFEVTLNNTAGLSIKDYFWRSVKGRFSNGVVDIVNE